MQAGSLRYTSLFRVRNFHFISPRVHVCNLNLKVCVLTDAVTIQRGIVQSNPRVQVANLNPQRKLEPAKSSLLGGACGAGKKHQETGDRLMKSEGYILIVEDSQTQARQLEAIMKQLGYRIAVAYSAREAISLVEQQKPVIVISDILMPEIDGYQLCQLLKRSDKFKDIAVILLTQLSDPKEIIRGLACGADDFIVKPYNEEFLLARIHATLALKTKQDMTSKLVTILVVEDSPTQAEQLRYLLEDKGYAVMVRQTAKKATRRQKNTSRRLSLATSLCP